MLRVLAVVPFCLLATSCADGGKEDRPISEVQFSSTHHLFGLRSLRGFGSFPVPTTAVNPDRGVLNLFDDGNYTVTRASGTSGAQRYALADAGDFSIFISGNGTEPSVVFEGAYGRVGATNLTTPGATPDFFFTDRVSTPQSPSIGLYYGTRIINGQVELEGGWHLFSLHAVFGASLQAPENVARGAHGGVNIAAGAPGTLRSISGTGFQFSSSLTFGGSIQNLLTNGTGNGACNLTVDYTLAGQSVDSRVMNAAATGNTVFAVDDDETDGEAGILFLVRKFDPPATAIDSVRVPGTFLVGGHTFFVNPTNSGSDTFVGTMTLSTAGGFRLDAVGNTGQDFSYAGNYTLNADGGITISVNGTNETWSAAIDRSYNTIVFVDDFVEARSNNIPELNICLGVRQKSS